MKIVIAGGSGFIGKALCAEISAAGGAPAILSRRPQGQGPWREIQWDGRSAGDWLSALEDADALVNLAGESVAAGRWTPERKQALLDSRLLSTRALVSALEKCRRRPKVLVSASAVGYYGDRGDTELPEDAGPGADFLAGLCVDWEREASKARDLGMRVVNLRIGIVLSKEGGALAKMLLPFKLGLGGPLGSGEQWMPWISRDDLIGLIQFAIKEDVSGPVNACAPNPVRNRDFAKALGRVLHRPAFLPAPAFALRLALGEMADLLLGGQRALPVAAVKAGFSFRHPNLNIALGAVLV